jgi:hypothetical protein
MADLTQSFFWTLAGFVTGGALAALWRHWRGTDR